MVVPDDFGGCNMVVPDDFGGGTWSYLTTLEVVTWSYLTTFECKKISARVVTLVTTNLFVSSVVVSWVVRVVSYFFNGPQTVVTWS